MSKTTDVLKRIENARENGDFDLVKQLSKRALENPQSDINPVLIMDQIAHMYLDSFLIWVHEMQKIDPTVNKDATLLVIAHHLAINQHLASKNLSILEDYTQYIKEMREADAEEVRNNFLSVDDDDVEKSKEARRDGRGIL